MRIFASILPILALMSGIIYIKMNVSVIVCFALFIDRLKSWENRERENRKNRMKYIGEIAGAVGFAITVIVGIAQENWLLMSASIVGILWVGMAFLWHSAFLQTNWIMSSSAPRTLMPGSRRRKKRLKNSKHNK